MARIITFSRTFPAYHPKAGEPTYFVEMILNDLGIDFRSWFYGKEFSGTIICWNDKIEY